MAAYIFLTLLFPRCPKQCYFQEGIHLQIWQALLYIPKMIFIAPFESGRQVYLLWQYYLPGQYCKKKKKDTFWNEVVQMLMGLTNSLTINTTKFKIHHGVKPHKSKPMDNFTSTDPSINLISFMYYTIDNKLTQSVV